MDAKLVLNPKVTKITFHRKHEVSCLTLQINNHSATTKPNLHVTAWKLYTLLYNGKHHTVNLTNLRTIVY